MKKMLTVSLGLLLFLGGCSENTSQAPMDGEGLYKRSCLNCHGADLQGGAAPGVKNMAAKYSEEEILDLINNGIGLMPGKLLSETEAETVTKWLMEQ
ncbi:MAG TPA: cytochrome C' [Bacillus bacterium]|nr:cytochrome C' [Bacillus sp. (in: firmicutes)]